MLQNLTVTWTFVSLFIKKIVRAAGWDFYVQFHFWTRDKYLVCIEEKVLCNVSFVISLWLLSYTEIHLTSLACHYYYVKELLRLLAAHEINVTSKVLSVIFLLPYISSSYCLWDIHRVEMGRTYLLLRWYFNSSRLSRLPVAVHFISFFFMTLKSEVY